MVELYEDNLRGWRDPEGRRHIQDADELSGEDDAGVAVWFPYDESDGEQGARTDAEGVPAHVERATAADAGTAVSMHAGLDAWH